MKKKTIHALMLISLLPAIMLSCSKMNSTYTGFIENGETIYPASPDSIAAYPGHNRVMLSWLLISDPTITAAKIYWNNGQDSLHLPIHRSEGTDTINVVIPDLEEGLYSFDVYTFDDAGNRSVVSNIIGQSYGSKYQKLLMNRTVLKSVYDADTLTIVWGPSDESSIGTLLRYTGPAGDSLERFIPAGRDTSYILDFGIDHSRKFYYQTLYKPDTAAIDTFYTDRQVVTVIGPPVAYDKNNWTASASSNRASNPPSYAIDNAPGTIWITSERNAFPQTLTVDMGAVVDPINGFSFMQRSPTENPHIQLISIEISNNGNDWTSLGSFVLKDVTYKQYIDLDAPVAARYFKVIVHSTYRDKPLISLAEAGVYYR